MTAEHIYVGIDPGLDGAIAVYRPRFALTIPREHLTVWPMPTTLNATTRKRHVSLPVLVQRLEAIDWMGDVALVVLEDVHASPQMGVTSAFSFGRTRGVLEGVLATHGWPVELVAPAYWKQRTRTPKDKAGAIARATEIFPDHAAVYWPKKGDDGKAEAAILAWYACERSKE